METAESVMPYVECLDKGELESFVSNKLNSTVNG